MAENLGEFIKQAAEQYQDKVAFEIKRGIRRDRFSFAQMYDLGARLATFLGRNGIKRGDKIVILAPNMPEYVLVFFGSWVAGVTVVPIDLRSKKETVEKFVKLTSPKLGFTSKYLPHPFEGAGFETLFLEDLVDEISDLPRAEPGGVKPEDIAEIVFTSGTTGVPKGVVLTHKNLLFDIERVLEVFPLNSSWRALSILPLSHALAQVVDLLACFAGGVKVIYLPRLNTLTLRKALKKHKITCMAIVPQFLSLMLKSIKRGAEQKDKLAQFELAQKIAPAFPMFLRRLLFREVHKGFGGNFKFFVCGSAPLDLKLAQAWENMGIKIYEGYGATEMTAGLTINTPKLQKLGSVGKVLPGMEARIDEDGEIWAKGENISPGYFKNPKKTVEAFVKDWYKSGDVGFFDEGEFLHILGRTAFKIVLPSGLKVCPEDIEKRLKSHPLVEEACVVGAKREKGEVVHAVIITPKPSKLRQIIDDVNKDLEEYQRISEASVWPDEDFPRTPILKIDRKKVLEWAESERSKKQPAKSGAFRRARHNAEALGGEARSRKIDGEDELIEILSEVGGISAGRIGENTTLGSDLKLDSLGRVELVSAVEERLGVTIPEQKISAQTTLKRLRNLIKTGAKVEREEVSLWPFEKAAIWVRGVLQCLLVFPLHGLFVKIEVKNKLPRADSPRYSPRHNFADVGGSTSLFSCLRFIRGLKTLGIRERENRENLAKVSSPAIFIFNHLGPYDGVCVPRVLPKALRKRLVSLGDSLDWRKWSGMLGFLVQLLGGVLAISHKGKVKRVGLESTGELAADGFSIVIAPEGRFSKTGKLGKFKPGVGMLAVELRLPVVPVKISTSYRGIFHPVPFGRWQNYVPKKRGKVTVTIGEPLSFPKDTSHIEAAERMREAMERL